jgi:starch synthase
VDPGSWDPRNPERAGLPFGFDPHQGDLEGKARCRSALLERLGIKEAAAVGPLFAFVGRLTAQKGIDVLLQALPQVLGRGSGRRFVILGQGERGQEDRLRGLAADPTSRGNLTFIPRYDPALATLIFAASDFFLIPSSYEPFGLTDFFAQILGSIPMVHSVGGLKKVRDGETGFSYVQQSGPALVEVIERVTSLFENKSPLLETVRRTGFDEVFSHHSWDSVLAEGYFPIYRRAMTEKSWTPR